MDNLAKKCRGEFLNASGSSPKQTEQCGEEFDIIEYKSQYREEFKKLNMEWIKKYFWIEPIDDEVLSDPEKHFLQCGGYIWFARLRYCEEIVGTCALLRHKRGFELAKMGVTGYYRGMGIGRKLAETALAQVKSLGEKQVFLETNSKLMIAMCLYKKLGFREKSFPHGHSERYQRANVYMSLIFE